MVIKSTYTLIYSIDKIINELVLFVELKKIEGLMKPRQNVWEGFASLNNKPYTDVDLSHCVNARLEVQSIGYKMRDEIKQKAKKEHKLFRIKKEEIS